jgi:uncharacterized protein
MLDLLIHGVLLAADLLWALVLGRTTRPVAATVLLGGVAAVAVSAVVLATTGDGFALMRAGCWLLFIHGPLVLAALAWHSRGRPGVQRVAIALALAALAVGFDAFFIEPRWVQVRQVSIPRPELTAPLRIVVLSDIQTDHVGDFERDVFTRATALEPDLILLPGDFLQVGGRGRDPQVAAFRALLPLLQAPLGVWAVQGNAEGPRWAEELFGGTHVQARAATHSVDLGALTLSALSFADGFDRAATLAGAAELHVAFAHSPDFALSAGVDADLLIAGHTHGGQVQLPLIGPLITLSWVDRAAAGGRPTPLGADRWLLVSRGLGMERGHAPRLRFLCRPEILVVDLVPSG